MFLIAEEVGELYPHIVDEVNIDVVHYMIYVHDGGEIVTGDLNQLHPDSASMRQRWKHREWAAFRLITQVIDDPYARQYARYLYKRAVSKPLDDPEALLTDIIDKVQGSRFGMKHVFHGRKLDRAGRQMQLNLSSELILRSALPMLALLSANAQTELQGFVLKEHERYREFGYREEVASYIYRAQEAFDRIMGA